MRPNITAFIVAVLVAAISVAPAQFVTHNMGALRGTVTAVASVPDPDFHHSFNNNGGTGTTATADQGDDCTLQNGAAWAEDPAMSGNYGIDFDGANDDLSCGTDLDAMTDFSVSWWANIDSYGEGSLGTVVSKATAAVSSWICHLNDLSSNGRLICRIGNTVNTFDTFATDIDSIDALIADGWHHFAFTVSGCASMGCTGGQIYIDGSAVNTTQIANNTGTRRDDAADTVWIGDSGANTATFEGDIDEVKVWATDVLTAPQVAAVFAAGR